MSIGLVGTKRGMTRVFNDAGQSVPVTVLEVEDNRVVQIKDLDSDGYRSVQVTTGKKDSSRVNKAEAGHFKKAKIEAGRGLWEFRVDQTDGPIKVQLGEDEKELNVGDNIQINLFTQGDRVDVSGRTIGKGYAGAIKRHNFSAQRATHGNSKAHRAPGSIGQNQSPGHVFKGKRMSGHMGDEKRTIQNLNVVRVDQERGLILVEGGIPGSVGSDVIIRPAVKQKKAK